MTDKQLPPGRVRMPFPIPQLRAVAPNGDAARYQAEVVRGGKPDEHDVMALSAAGFDLFQAISEAHISPAESEALVREFNERALATAASLGKLPMPQGPGLDASDGKVYSPYLFMLGLNLLSHGMAEISPETTMAERLAMVTEFVRTWAMFAQMSAYIDTPGLDGGAVRYIAASHVVVQPPFLPHIAKLHAAVQAMRAKEPKPESERDIPVAPGDGEAGVKRPKFKLQE